MLSQERHGHTLAATGLVNEAYLRLHASGQPTPVQDRKHFFALAARVMRHVLVDHATARRADKRGAGATHVTLSGADAVASDQADAADVLSVHQALELLEQADARAAKVTELKVFGGMEIAEIAETLGVSEPTVKRDWVFARAWLTRHLAD
jgi:RNA polymerase sigma factor (TIGR02999 family)